VEGPRAWAESLNEDPLPWLLEADTPAVRAAAVGDRQMDRQRCENRGVQKLLPSATKSTSSAIRSTATSGSGSVGPADTRPSPAMKLS
jgi:hypothetical protein